MSNLVTGSCNCGRHRYTIPTEPLPCVLILPLILPPFTDSLQDCMDCQKWAGAMHSAHPFVRTSTFQTTSPEPKKWITKAENGNEMERAWCDECGTVIWFKVQSQPEMTFLKAGLFDHEIPNPTTENWLKNMEPWETPARGTKRTSQGN